MKKKIIALAFLSMLVLGACGREDTNTENDEAVNDDLEEVSEDTENETVEFDKKLVNVDITLPASFLTLDGEEEIDFDEMKEEAKENGIKNVALNHDGSCYVK